MKTLIITGSVFFIASSGAGCAQKTIQKQINVAGGANADYFDEDQEYIRAECLKISTSRKDFEDILSKNGKVVIQSARWSQSISYRDAEGDAYEATCFGPSYIVEGPESVLKDSE